MHSLHILLMTAGAVLVAVTAAGKANLRRRGHDLPLTGQIIGGAAVVGNAACLLPTSPAWYRVAMISLTVAGIAWFLVSVASAPRATESDAELASRDIYAGLIPTRPAPERPELRVVHATVVEPDDSTDACSAGTTDIPALRPVATQETFADATPGGNTVPTGATHVAANIGEYVDTRGTRRAHGRYGARAHASMDPTERFLRLADAYSIDRGPRSLGRSHRT